ncbi:hypothetical protein L3X38_028828 [Prunus dulcis]|uniref:Uncharacterized protein n=1 Tax=Prunus dulcis TaxID=3755 RepID=A0AAD4VSV9_PRUDU|nr:hypothetical protein L3X38_028828 [Prunus dulcis]
MEALAAGAYLVADKVIVTTKHNDGEKYVWEPLRFNLYEVFPFAFAIVSGETVDNWSDITEIPTVPKFSVDNASLTQFNYTKTNHSLSYNLALNITITNSKKYIGLEYSDIQVTAYYGKTRFAFVTLVNETASFHQNPNTTVSFENVACSRAEVGAVCGIKF